LSYLPCLRSRLPKWRTFGELIDKTRAVLHSPKSIFPKPEAGRAPGCENSWRELISNRNVLSHCDLFRFYQSTGLQKGLRQFRLLNKTKLALLEAQLRLVDKPCNSDGKLARKPGAGNLSEQRQAARRGRPLPRLRSASDRYANHQCSHRRAESPGYTVHVPRLQTCCGALHQHGGELEEAQKLVNSEHGGF
jgi:glycolate oxidase iron-sulfur subunit